MTRAAPHDAIFIVEHQRVDRAALVLVIERSRRTVRARRRARRRTDRRCTSAARAAAASARRAARPTAAAPHRPRRSRRSTPTMSNSAVDSAAPNRCAERRREAQRARTRSSGPRGRRFAGAVGSSAPPGERGRERRGPTRGFGQREAQRSSDTTRVTAKRPVRSRVDASPARRASTVSNVRRARRDLARERQRRVFALHQDGTTTRRSARQPQRRRRVRSRTRSAPVQSPASSATSTGASALARQPRREPRDGPLGAARGCHDAHVECRARVRSASMHQACQAGMRADGTATATFTVRRARGGGAARARAGGGAARRRSPRRAAGRRDRASVRSCAMLAQQHPEILVVREVDEHRADAERDERRREGDAQIVERVAARDALELAERREVREQQQNQPDDAELDRSLERGVVRRPAPARVVELKHLEIAAIVRLDAAARAPAEERMLLKRVERDAARSTCGPAPPVVDRVGRGAGPIVGDENRDQRHHDAGDRRRR